MEDGCGVISAGLYLQSWRCKVDATCLMCHVCIQSSRPGGPVGTPRVEATDHGAVTRPRRAPAGGVGARAGKLAYRSPIGADGPDPVRVRGRAPAVYGRVRLDHSNLRSPPVRTTIISRYAPPLCIQHHPTRQAGPRPGRGRQWTRGTAAGETGDGSSYESRSARGGAAASGRVAGSARAP